MSITHVDRRLATILAADVVGYSRLIGRDEEGTLARLKAHRVELVVPLVARHHGRIVKLMGDGILCEFQSVVEAVRCAVLVQQGIAQREHGTPHDERIRLRIGVNLGDVVHDDGDVFGDCVNIAARLEQLAEPGGVAIGGAAFDHLQGKLDLPLVFAGQQRVKNIERAVRVYRVRLDGVASGRPGRGRLRHRPTLAAAVALIGLVVAGGLWWLRLSSPEAPARTAGPAVATRDVAASPPAQPASQRLSIVVLPFANLGSDREQDYFADGITDDLTTDLARIDDSFVISPNTARTYKGKAIDARAVGRELGVRYILEGSLRRIEGRVRVNAQLIDAATGGEAWADRFEADWTRASELQDAITGRLARTLDLQLTDAESRRAEALRPDNPSAVDLSMRGWSALNRPAAREAAAAARDLFEQALRIDPQLPEALVGLAKALFEQANNRWSLVPAEDLARADAALTGVLATSPDYAMAHFVKGEILRLRLQFDPAIAEYEAAIASNRNLAPAYGAISNAEVRAGRAEEAFAPAEKAIRLSPRDPLLKVWYFFICHAHTHLAQDDAAIEWCNRSLAAGAYWITYVDLASAYAWTGRAAEAQAAVAKLRELMPGYTVDRWAHERWSDDPVFLKQYQRIVEGLRKAGLPET